MKEEYLHYAFDKRMFGSNFVTHENKAITILDFGELNVNAGPDFLDAKIDYDGHTWAGAIEFHVKGSDWYRHNHQNDPAYGTTIAHFVYENDQIVQLNGVDLPTVELKNQVDLRHYEMYKKLLNNKDIIPCASQIKNVPLSVFHAQMLLSLHSRLREKSLIILSDIETVSGNQTKAYLLAVARCFGNKVNQLLFEQLILKLEMKWLAKLNYDCFRLEALFLGLCGFLESEGINEPYFLSLKEEFNYQKILFGFKSFFLTGWKYSRMRPSNFPDRRMAQFAHFTANFLLNQPMIDQFLELKQIDSVAQLKLNDFWKTHYRIHNSTKISSDPNLSNDFVDLLKINVCIPFNYAIGWLQGDDVQRNKAIQQLKLIAPEKNTILKDWNSMGISALNAFDSQALLALKKQSCIKKNCLFCGIGKSLLNR